MANRSYLYSTDSVPDANARPKTIRGLSECNGGIPPSHLILASFGARRCQSLIHEDAIGVAADYAGGVRRLLSFLEVLHEVAAPGPRFDAALAEAEQFLSSPQQRGKYILLEAAELFGLSGRDLVGACDRLVTMDLPEVAERVELAIDRQEDDWLRELGRIWEQDLGLYWSAALYYHFEPLPP